MQIKTPRHWRWIVPLLLVAPLLACLKGYEDLLKVGAVPLGEVSLQLAAHTQDAYNVMAAWLQAEPGGRLIELAKTLIRWDYLLIALYGYGLFWAMRAAEFVFGAPGQGFLHKVAWVPVVAAALDAIFENPGMLWMLSSPDEVPSIWISGAVAVAAWLKWLLLLLSFLYLAATLVVGILRPRRPVADGTLDLTEGRPLTASPAQVLHLELDHISSTRVRAVAAKSAVDRDDDDRAAWKRAYDSDLFGLALSGGGIRSATFALGVLQALARRGLLSRVDYLSTVSGGGYIGAWLSAWARRIGGIGKVQEELARSGTPVAPIEFLRAYSNYLTPRTGIFGVDTWTAIATWMRNFSVNIVILIAFVWAALAALMLSALVAGQSGLVLGTCAALLLLVGIASVTFGVTLEVDPGTPVWGRLVSSRAVHIGVIAALPLACAGGGFWWAQWGADHPIEALYGPAKVVIGAGVLVWVVSFVCSVYANRTARLAGTAGKGAAQAQRFPDLETIVLYFASVAAGVGVLIAVVWKGTPLLPDFANALFGGKSGSLDALAAGLKTATVMIFSPVLVLVGMLAGVYAAIFLLGPGYSDKGREWWARIGGWFSLMIIFWLLVVGSSFVIPGAVHWLGAGAGSKSNLNYALGIAWAAITGLTGLIARSGVSAGAGGAAKALVIKIGPYVAAIGFYVVATYWFFTLACTVFEVKAQWPAGDAPFSEHVSAGAQMLMAISIKHYFWLAAACGLVSLVLALRADINLFSLRDFYKNRLVRAYLGATNPRRPANVDDFTGFSPSDDMPLWDLRKNGRPYHLINTALNIVHGRRLAWQERKAASFLFSPLYCGYSLPQPERDDTDMNFRSTLLYADDGRADGGVTLGEAMALSGAALSPNRGQGSTPILTLLMTLLNVRLGGWLPNPRFDERASSPPIAGEYLLQELFGLTNERTRYVNVSDGGHFENLGVYELIRRRCRVIVVSDAGEDAGRVFDDLGACIRKCQIDFNVRIDLDVTRLIPYDQRVSETGWAAGRIAYPAAGGGTLEGVILYLKASITEPVRHDASLLSYLRMHGVFPHHSTTDQWFGESTFESYRALGEQLADALCAKHKGVLGIA